MTASRTAAFDERAAAALPSFAPSGVHWLIDGYEAPCALLADAPALEALLCDAALAAGAHVLFRHFHRFGSSDGGPAQVGVTGVVLLAESHITIHTWPEHGFAAIDLFLCGAADAERAIDTIERGLGAGRLVTHVRSRGDRDRMPVPRSA